MIYTGMERPSGVLMRRIHKRSMSMNQRMSASIAFGAFLVMEAASAHNRMSVSFDFDKPIT
jgi:hypothetical protein